MRKLLTKVSSKINQIAIGTVNDTKTNEIITPLNCLVPYAAASEDFEIILRNEKLLGDKQPIEMNGFNSHLNMKKAVKIGGESGRIDSFYSDFTLNHPVLMSYPSEVIWLGIEKGVTRFKNSFDWVAKRSDLGIDPSRIADYSNIFQSAIERNTKNYGFWKEVLTHNDSKMSRILLESTLNMAILSRSTFLSGLTPLLTKTSTTVGVLSQRMNLAYGALINDYEDIGEKCPKYFYTINLDSSLIPKDNYTDELRDIAHRARGSLETNHFDGIFVSIRGLKNLSESEGRVNVLKKLIESLCDATSDEKLPIWFSRTGLISLELFEQGASYGSFQLNNKIDDVYSGFAPKKPIDPTLKYGTVLDPDTNRILNPHQVLNAHHNLTPLDGVSNKPNDYISGSDVNYRKYFSKPYNIAAMRYLNQKWLNNVQAGETNPGSEYLSRFTEPSYYCNWGIH